MGPDYHLVHTLIPNRIGQSRGFPQRRHHTLSLFCKEGFIAHPLPLVEGKQGVFSKSTIATQGRLHCTQHYTACRFYPEP